MSEKYHTARIVEITLDGNSIEVEAAISYTIAPFIPAKGPSYASGGQPAEGGHVEDIWCKGIRFIGTAINHDCPTWLEEWIVSVVDGESLYAEAMEYEADKRERAADDRYEMMREDRQRGEWPHERD